MKAKILMINPPMVMTTAGTYMISDFQGQIRPQADFDTETMKVLTGAEEACSV